MKSRNILISFPITGLLLLAGLLAALNANAQDYWTGSGNGSTFGDGNNWSSTAVPTTGDLLEFSTSGSFTTLTNDLIGYAFPSITYDASGLGFTIIGNAFTNGTSTAGTIITVNSANAQTINNNITLGNNNQTINLASGNLTLGGVLSGAGTASGLTLTGSGTTTLTLSGANTYGSAGATTNSLGTIKIGNASAVGASRLYVANGATVDLNGNNLNVAFINNVGALTGGIIDNVSAGGTVTLKVGSGQGGTTASSTTWTAVDSFSGIIKNTTGTVGLTKVAGTGQSAGIVSSLSYMNGSAVLRLINTNAYSGPTTINGGMIELNFNNANNGGSAVLVNILPSASTLVMAGGDLILDNPTGVSPSQTVAGLTLNAGASHIGAYRQSSQSTTINLNGITRNTGSTIDFQSRPNAGSSSNQHIGGADGTDNTTNVEVNFTGGQQTILGGYATYNAGGAASGGTWATTANNTANASKAIGGLAVGSYNSGFAAGKDVDATTGTSTPASMFINSLRFSTAGAYTVNTAGNITNATGGILENPSVTNNPVAINNNNLTSGNGQDLIIHQYNTFGGMTIGANIVDNSTAIGLTKSGRGDLTLTPNAANTFSGQLTINAGSVTLGNANALNGVPALVFGGTSQTTTNQGFFFVNGTLNLNGNSASVSSLTASADSSGTALVQNSNSTPATLTVNGSATTSFTGTLQDGTGGGALSLVKSGSGTQTIGGTLSYSGSTTVSAGTLALTTPTTNTASYAVTGTLDVTALTSNTLALTSPQTLSGSGTVAGSVIVASGAHTRPGATGVTNTITGNLTYATGAKADFDLNTSAAGANDQIILSGSSSVLNCGGVAININLIGASLSTTTDYVLFRLTGGSASISGSFISVPTWLGTVPANSGSYTIITDTVNKNVRLHFVASTPPAVVGGASPSTVVRNQSVFVSVTNAPGSGTITNVYLDLSLINGTNYVQMYLSGVANVYTNTIVIPAAAAPVGSTHVVAYATDTTPLTGSGNIALNIVATAEVWSGLSASTADWSDNTNWVSVLAPGLVGDSVAFDGTTQTSPSMDNSYSVTSLSFPSTAGAFTIGTANGSVLTLTGPVTNNSTSAQILNVPVAITATQVVNTAAGNVTLGSAISGGGLTKVGNNTLFLGSSGNTFSGGTVISNGTVSLNSGANIGSGQITLAGGTLTSGYTTTRLTLGNAINVPANNTGTILMSALNQLNGAVTGGGLLNVSAPGTQDDLSDNWSAFAGQVNFFGGGTLRWVINGGGFGSGFNAGKVTLTNVTVSVSDNSTGNTINIGALTMDSTATFSGPYQGANPLLIIGALNQNDYIGGTVSGSTRITKTGSGILTIDTTATANYTGPTWINLGTLTVLGAISASPVTNYSGATLAGTGSFGAVVDLETGSFITPVVGGYGTMTCSSDLTINGGTNIVYLSTTNSSLIAVGGNLNLLAGGIKLILGDTLTNGIYKLMTYGGSLGGAAGNLTLSGFSQAGKTAVLSDSTTGEIDLLVTTPTGANLVWASVGNQNNYWDIGSSINWSNGPSLSIFNVGDHVTFNDFGAGNTTIDVRAAVLPSTMVVTGAQAYVFQSTLGTGRISGPTNSLVVKGPGSAEIDMVNDYGGTTTIGSGSTLTFGNGSGGASPGTGPISNDGVLVFNQTNNLSLTNITGAGTLTANGTGTLTLAGTYGYAGTTTIGSGATLQVGIGGATGPLANTVTDNGTLIMNQSGNVTMNNSVTGAGAFIQNGSSTLTLNTAETYQGNTYINHGVLKLGASDVIPDAVAVSGSTGWFILDGNATNAGTFDLNGFNETVNLLQGLSGTVLGDITNSSTANVTNTLTFGNDFVTAANTYAGLITENAAGGKIALVKQGLSTNILTGANSYTGGTVVKGGTLTLGNGGAAGGGSITLSNGATIGMIPSGAGSIFPGNSITTAAGAIATNTSSSLANAFTGLFSGAVDSTNVITSFVSVSSAATKQFQGFNGTVVVDAGSQLRFSSSTLGTNGSDNTTFDIEGTLNTRNGTVAGPGVSLGALTGSGNLNGAGNAAGNTTYTIGAKGVDSTFAGTIQDTVNGNVSVVKVGAGELTLSGAASYTGVTTVSNGTLALVEPVSLDSSPMISLGSGTAAIDVSGRSDGTLNLGNTAAQTLSALGTIKGSLNEAANSSVRVTLGTLTVTNAAALNGIITLQVNRTNAVTHSEIVASSFSIAGPLTVTNVGPALQGGDTFQLFSTGVSGFTATNLPTLTGSMYWTNKLALNGSIAVVNPVNTSPPPIITSFNGSILSLSWPTNSGWTLQAQTNNLGVGLVPGAGNWVDLVPGSTGITSTNLTVDRTKPTVFYRLKL